ncbi:hypothetical protein GDO81_030198 [Engystomops pustulosus]|uniref:Sleeping Beauty transposase HTH domain-containing protein n=1 Tax=Engystomops pustulosus TaxID=76066 RepID=A0AAV6ZH01_ENGPU|nr:hypothetical protein GDO81_030198 [Engystomops pustulosus]
MVAGHKAGEGYKTLPQELGLPVSSVGSIIRKWKAYGATVSLPRPGQPLKVSSRAEARLVQRVKANPRTTRKEPAAVATAVPDVYGDGSWMSLHNHYVASSKDKEPEVVFIGDSNVMLLHQLEIWRELFSPLHALNFGGLGEGTQHVLWRLENGELEHIRPKRSRLLGGVPAIVRCMEQRQPQAKVIVLGLLPRGKNPNPLRERNRRVNELLAEALPSTPNAVLLDADPGFVQSDGSISHHDLYDYLHLSRLGYSRLCPTLHRELLRLLEGSAAQQ